MLIAQSKEKAQEAKTEESLNQVPSVKKDSLVQRPVFDSIQTLFQQLQGYQKILIKTNLDSLIAHKKEPKEQPATIIATGKEVDTLTFSVQLEQRGVYRRLRCEYPPVRINFSKKELECKQEVVDTTSLMREFWVYKLFNQVTEKSFEVHQLELTYVHDQDSSRMVKNHVFIIENVNELAHRIGGFVYKNFGKEAKDLELSSYQNVLLFNYMIGNTDWHLQRAKNVKLVQDLDGKLSPVPYDFDFSGLVRPLYIDFTKVKEERRYHGVDLTKVEWEEVKNHFLSKKETLLKVIKDFDHLSPQAKGDMRRYIKTFYKELPDMDLSDLNFSKEAVKRVLSK